MITLLPPGHQTPDFPRFGLTQFAHCCPTETRQRRIEVAGDVEQSTAVDANDLELTRVEQVCDFHCVTTWCHRGLRWSGFRFAEFYQRIVVAQARPRWHASQCCASRTAIGRACHWTICWPMFEQQMKSLQSAEQREQAAARLLLPT